MLRGRRGVARVGEPVRQSERALLPLVFDGKLPSRQPVCEEARRSRSRWPSLEHEHRCSNRVHEALWRTGCSASQCLGRSKRVALGLAREAHEQVGVRTPIFFATPCVQSGRLMSFCVAVAELLHLCESSESRSSDRECRNHTVEHDDPNVTANLLGTS